MVPWLRLHVSTEGAQVRSPVGDLRSHMMPSKPKNKQTNEGFGDSSILSTECEDKEGTQSWSNAVSTGNRSSENLGSDSSSIPW